jgi:hypothetical protein
MGEMTDDVTAGAAFIGGAVFGATFTLAVVRLTLRALGVPVGFFKRHKDSEGEDRE